MNNADYEAKDINLAKIRQELAVVLRTQAFSDNDLILTLLSESNGKLSAIFKKSRGKSAYSPEILDLANFELKTPSVSSNLYGVRGFKSVKSFIGLRNKLPSFLCACAWIEAIDCLTLEAHQEASELFTICCNTLSELNVAEDQRQALRLLFESLQHALQLLGYGQHQNEKASLNNLKALIFQIETLSHRKLKSFEEVYSLINRIGKA